MMMIDPYFLNALRRGGLRQAEKEGFVLMRTIMLDSEVSGHFQNSVRILADIGIDFSHHKIAHPNCIPSAFISRTRRLLIISVICLYIYISIRTVVRGSFVPS